MSSEIENLIKEASAAGLARADKVLATRQSAEEGAQKASASVEKKGPEQEIRVTLQEQKKVWIGRIESASTQEQLNAITTEAFNQNGKYVFLPGFVVGKFLIDLFATHPSLSDEVKKRLEDEAFKFQEEIEAVYLAKKESFSHPAGEAGKDVDTSGVGINNRRAKKHKVAPVVVTTDAGKAIESNSEVLAMAELVEFKDDLIKKINNCQSIEELEMLSSDVTKNALRDSFLGDIIIKYKLNTVQGQQLYEKVRPLRIEIHEAHDKREQELRDAKEFALGMGALVASFGSKDAPKNPGDSGVSAGEKATKVELPKNWEELFGRAPVEGDSLRLKSKGGAEQTIYFDHTEETSGFYSKSGRFVSFEEIVKKMENGWKIETLLSTTDSGEARETENEKKIEEELLARKTQLLDIIFHADSIAGLDEGLKAAHFSLMGDGFLSILKKHSFASPEREAYFYGEAAKFLRNIEYTYNDRRIELKEAARIQQKKDAVIESPIKVDTEGRTESNTERLMMAGLRELRNERIEMINNSKSVGSLDTLVYGSSFRITKSEALSNIFGKYPAHKRSEEMYIQRRAVEMQKEIDAIYGEKRDKLLKVEEARKKALPENPAELTEAEKRLKVLDAEIEELEGKEGKVGIIAELRAEYVKEDHKISSLLNRLKNVFGRGVGQDADRPKKDDYLKQLAVLKEKKLEKLRLGESSGEDFRKKAEGLSRYFKLDESDNIIDARLKYRAENQGFPGWAVNSLGDLGRAYNRTSIKKKLLLTGVLAGITIAVTLSGGTAAIGAMAFVSGAKRVAAGLGTAVGTEALLESFGERNRKSSAEKEIKSQIETMKIESLHAKPEITLDALNAFLDKDITSLDAKLQSEKKAKIWRKVGAAGFGALVGSGWLTRFAVDHLGGHVVVDWAKDHLNAVFGGTHPDVAPRQLTPTQIWAERELATPLDKPASIFPEPGTGQVAQLGLSPMTDSVDRFHGSGVASNTPSASPEDLGKVADITKINEFISKDIEVKKGDSVWKIAGGLADKLGLEDAQRTHFIDALKDQYGDVQLKAGETINFSEHGIDKDFVENALAHAKGLTEGQMASIDANDVKIAEFASSNPDVTLTNESVDKILHGNTADALSQSGVSGSGGADLTQAYDGDGGMEEGAGETRTTATDIVGKDAIHSADIQYDRDIVFGKTYDLAKYKEYFVQYPDAFQQFQKIDSDYKKFLFPDNTNAFQDVKGKTFGALGDLKEKSLGRFVEMSKKTYGAKLGMPGAKEKVYEYLTRIAMLGLEHPKGMIRLPQSI